jgi:hypothetical protein
MTFDEWYQTEGIRFLAPNGEHLHEAWMREAFNAGRKAQMTDLIQDNPPNRMYIMDEEDEIQSLKAQLELERRARDITISAFIDILNKLNAIDK